MRNSLYLKAFLIKFKIIKSKNFKVIFRKSYAMYFGNVIVPAPNDWPSNPLKNLQLISNGVKTIKLWLLIEGLL